MRVLELTYNTCRHERRAAQPAGGGRDPRTTKLYERTVDEITLDIIEQLTTPAGVS